MFKETPANNETETIIGPSVKIEGDFITEGNIIVEGMVCGTIKTSRDLRVGSKSKIFANVSAENVLIAGEVQGNIRVKEKLELTSTARVYGDIKTNILIIASGSVLNGKCQMGDGKSKTAKPNFSKQEKIELKSRSAATNEDEELEPMIKVEAKSLKAKT
ncbi:polymer-forming cytoskeletal protein [Candidatus Falkowbacteria bacterium]|nr:polymer-forming cytoskeletal protein [Candidatus Falkowbacteria bacterium]